MFGITLIGSLAFIAFGLIYTLIDSRHKGAQIATEPDARDSSPLPADLGGDLSVSVADEALAWLAEQEKEAA